MKNVLKKKRALVAILALIVVGLVAGTIAYNYDRSIFTNIFGVQDFKTEFIETFDSPDNWQPCDEIPKTVIAKNDSGVRVNVRLSYEEFWKAKNGGSLPLTRNGVKLAIINFQNEDDWELRSDGWYYFKAGLAPGESTNSLFKSVKLDCSANFGGENICTETETGKTCQKEADEYADAEYHLKITVQMIAGEFPSVNTHTAWFLPLDTPDDGPIVKDVDYNLDIWNSELDAWNSEHGNPDTTDPVITDPDIIPVTPIGGGSIEPCWYTYNDLEHPWRFFSPFVTREKIADGEAISLDRSKLQISEAYGYSCGLAWQYAEGSYKGKKIVSAQVLDEGYQGGSTRTSGYLLIDENFDEPGQIKYYNNELVSYEARRYTNSFDSDEDGFYSCQYTGAGYDCHIIKAEISVFRYIPRDEEMNFVPTSDVVIMPVINVNTSLSVI
jgi:hypothetical protein